MRPSHLEPLGSERRDRRQTWSQDHLSAQVQSQQGTRRSRFEDSWIDVSSQPSASTLASHTDRDEIITTGLQVRRDRGRRSRHLQLGNMSRDAQPRSTSVAGSSQDEYDESSSESDRVMSSSNEEVSNTSNLEGEEEDGEEDDTQTALGVRSRGHNIFTPQPNAFSHPPTSKPISNSQPVDSYFPPHQPPPPSSSHRIPSNRVPTIQRPAHQRASSNITPDHDAALRASLTTLLSCANAVRKDRDPSQQQTVQRSNQPTALRLVPESALNARSPPRSPKISAKRRSRESSKERHAKKMRAVSKQMATPDDLAVSPTMMTWFISAGVVIVFSAISFSAGYAWGKEVGRYEAELGVHGASCGREAIRSSRTGLSKLRLSAVSA